MCENQTTVQGLLRHIFVWLKNNLLLWIEVCKLQKRQLIKSILFGVPSELNYSPGSWDGCPAASSWWGRPCLAGRSPQRSGSCSDAVRSCRWKPEERGEVRERPYMMSAKFSDFSTPLVRKFTQPPLLRLLTMSAFEGTPPPPSVRTS